MITTCEFHNLIGMFAIIRLFSKPKRGLGYAKENRRNLFCNQRRNLLGFDGCRSASADGRFRLYSRRSGRRPASGCLSAAADVRAFLHAPITSEVFFSTRRSKRHSALRSARPAHPTDVFLSDSVQQRRHRPILAATIPVFTTIWDIFVKHRAPQIREMACTALAIIAVVLITTKGDFDSVSLSL